LVGGQPDESRRRGGGRGHRLAKQVRTGPDAAPPVAIAIATRYSIRRDQVQGTQDVAAVLPGGQELRPARALRGQVRPPLPPWSRAPHARPHQAPRFLSPELPEPHAQSASHSLVSVLIRCAVWVVKARVAHRFKVYRIDSPDDISDPVVIVFKVDLVRRDAEKQRKDRAQEHRQQAGQPSKETERGGEETGRRGWRTAQGRGGRAFANERASILQDRSASALSYRSLRALRRDKRGPSRPILTPLC
jgi:hypothetical protein